MGQTLFNCLLPSPSPGKGHPCNHKLLSCPVVPGSSSTKPLWPSPAPSPMGHGEGVTFFSSADPLLPRSLFSLPPFLQISGLEAAQPPPPPKANVFAEGPETKQKPQNPTPKPRLFPVAVVVGSAASSDQTHGCLTKSRLCFCFIQ